MVAARASDIGSRTPRSCPSTRPLPVDVVEMGKLAAPVLLAKLRKVLHRPRSLGTMRCKMASENFSLSVIGRVFTVFRNANSLT